MLTLLPTQSNLLVETIETTGADSRPKNWVELYQERIETTQMLESETSRRRRDSQMHLAQTPSLVGNSLALH